LILECELSSDESYMVRKKEEELLEQRLKTKGPRFQEA
jgi:hypothetical protein